MDLGGVNVASAMQIIAKAIEIAKRTVPEGQQRDYVEDLVRSLAAGPDGTQGTADDIIPPATVAKLLSLLRMGVVGDIVEVFSGTKPKFSGASCFGWCR